MKQPLGIVYLDYSHHVRKLKRTIYGLKQVPRAWFHKFSCLLPYHGCVCTQVDTSYIHVCLVPWNYHFDFTYLCSWHHFNSSSSAGLHNFISLLSHQFVITDLGDLHCFLGVQMVCTSKGIFVTQQNYVQDLISNFHVFFTYFFDSNRWRVTYMSL